MQETQRDVISFTLIKNLEKDSSPEGPAIASIICLSMTSAPKWGKGESEEIIPPSDSKYIEFLYIDI